MRAVRQFWALTRQTALEALRQPLALLLAMTAIVLTALTPLMTMHNFGEYGKLARDSGLAFHLVFGLLIAGTSASSSLAHERSSGTASAVLSKPVTRAGFFLAKFAGVGLVVMVFSTAAGLATLLAERTAERFVTEPGSMGYVLDWRTGVSLLAVPPLACLPGAILNYRSRRSFGSTAFLSLVAGVIGVFLLAGLFDRRGGLAPYALHVNGHVVAASLLVALALLVFVALAVSLATRCGTVLTVGSCVVVLMVGLASDTIFGAQVNLPAVFHLLYGVIPNWQHFWVSEALAGGGQIPWAYVVSAAAYAGACIMALLGVGMLAFRGADIN